MRHIVLAALVVVAACQHAAKSEVAAPAAPADVVSAAKGAIEQWRQAYELRDPDALAKLYAHETDTVIVLDGQELTGWGQIESTLRDKLQHAKDIRVRLRDENVKSLAPNVATAMATMSREMSDGVTTVTEQGVLTLVLRKDADGWKIVVEHYSYRRPS